MEYARAQIKILGQIAVAQNDQQYAKEKAEVLKKDLLQGRAQFPKSSLLAYYLGELNHRFLKATEEAISEYQYAASLDPDCNESREFLFDHYRALADDATGDQKEQYELEVYHWAAEMVRSGVGVEYGNYKKELQTSAMKFAVLIDSDALMESHLMRLADFYATEYSKCQKNTSLIWLAFLAQRGSDEAYAHLVIVLAVDTAYVAFARGLVCLYGSADSSKNYPAPERALHYFKKAYEMDPAILENYIQLVDQESSKLMSEGLRHTLRSFWEKNIVPKVKDEAAAEVDAPKPKF